MNFCEHEGNGPSQKNEELKLTMVSLERITQDSVQLENPLQRNLLKLPTTMKGHCSIRLRLLCNFNREHSLDALFTLSPECQIKILEENLNFLYNKSSTDVQMNCTPFGSNVSANTHLPNGHRLTFCSEVGLSELAKCKEETELNLKTLQKKDITNDLQTIKVNTIKLDENPDPFTKIPTKHTADLSSFISKPDQFDNSFKEKRKTNYLPLCDNDFGKAVNTVAKPECENQIIDSAETNHDSDSHFEFTVEQEQIVSFVCSPSPPRKEMQPNYLLNGCLGKDSDQDSDSQSEFTSSKGDSPSDTFSSVSCKSNTHEEGYRPKLISKSNKPCKRSPLHEKSLWHITPPVQSQKDNTLGYYCPTNKIQMKTNVPERMDQMTAPGNNGKCYDKGQLQNSFSQETILFRETSLRGCYNLENLLKVLRPPLPSVEQEVSRVREAIFLAIRPQRNNDDLISDSVLSILNICKSWIKLNSHFEKNDFKVTLETHGVNTSILHEFSQWQCVTRTFIDTMINSLHKITRAQHTGPCIQHHLSTPIFGPSSKTQCNCGHNNQPSVTLQGINLSNHPTMSSQKPTLTNDALVANKQWKQRRCHNDQPKTNVRAKKLCKTKFTVSGLYNSSQLPVGPSCNNEPVCGHGDSAPMCCSSRSYLPLASTSCQLSQTCSGFCSNEPKFSLDTSTSNYNKNQFLQNSPSSSQKHIFSEISDKNIYPMSRFNECLSNAVPLTDMPNNHSCPMTMQQFLTIPPVHNNQFGLMTQGQVQAGFSQSLLKPNPIHCFDNDVTGSFSKSSYIKPGCYNPPQKPTHVQKVVNNSVPIEDVPLVGIPFLYSNSQTQDLSKALKLTSTSEESVEKSCTKTSDDVWKSALVMAESFRDNLMSTRSDSSPNLKISETVSFKSHFLLSDEASQNSSSNDFKPKCENDELNSMDNRSSLELSLMDANIKTSDWLIKSFYKAVPGTEMDAVQKNKEPDSTCTEHELGVGENENDKNYNSDEVAKRSDGASPPKLVNKAINLHYINYEAIYPPKNKLTQEIRQSTQTFLHHKKPKKNKKFCDDFITTYDHRPEVLDRKPKSIFKRSVNKHVSCKLEDILNCIWNTEVSNLIGDQTKTGKDTTKLEMKVRSPLYFQAMRCKLSNHSYDTLEQALNDFHQYFVDIRARNKGDKQCLEAVKALEQIFLNSVEEQFGLMYQPTPQYFGPIGLSPSFRTRKPKKNTRRF